MAKILSTRRALVLLPCMFLFWTRVAAVDKDQPVVTFHSQSNEVRLTFSAADGNDRGVATLRASDFVVVDSDVVVRSFRSFGHSDWTRFEIGIIADNSDSVAPQFRHELYEILDLLSHSRPEENLAVFAFEHSRPALVCASDCSESHIAERLAHTPRGELTPLYDTIIFAADYLAHRNDPQTEKILIVFSDGGDTFSDMTLADAVQAAIHDEVEIFCVDLSASVSRKTAVLSQLSSATGGRHFRTHSGIAPISSAILETLQTTYTVVYSVPSHATGFHSVWVMPTHDLHLQFRSRGGYFYPDKNR